MASRCAKVFAGAGIGQIVGRHVDRLDGGDRAGARRGDALLQLAHLGRERRLVPDGARHAAEQGRDLGARLHEAEDVVDEEQRVLALVAEVLGHRQAGEADAQARARRLVHLAVDECDLVDHLGLGHLEEEVVALARPLADAREDRDAAVLASNVVDQLLDQHRLADAGAAEEADLAALDVRRDQVDDFQARLEDLDRRREVAEGGRVAVDRPALDVGPGGRLVVDRVADHVPDPAQRRVADGHRDRLPRVDHVRPAREPVGRVHRDRADTIVAEVLLHLRDQRGRAAVGGRHVDAQSRVDLRQALVEDGVEHDALDLDDRADVRRAGLLRHGSPGGSLVGLAWRSVRRTKFAQSARSLAKGTRRRPS